MPKFLELARCVVDNSCVPRKGLVRLCIAQQAPEKCDDKLSGALSKAAAWRPLSLAYDINQILLTTAQQQLTSQFQTAASW